MAWFHRSRSCIGAPTILLRPTTTACLPASCTPERKASVRQRTREAALLRMPPKWENSGQVHKSRFLASKSNLPKTIPSLATQGFSYKLGLVHVSFLLWVFERSLSQDPFTEAQESGEKTYTQIRKKP